MHLEYASRSPENDVGVFPSTGAGVVTPSQLAEKLNFDARVDVDHVDEIEASLVDRTAEPFDAVVQATAGAAACLDIGADEAGRVLLASLGPRPELPDGRSAVPRQARGASPRPRRPPTAGCIVGGWLRRSAGVTASRAHWCFRAARAQDDVTAAEDPLWLGAIRGVLINAKRTSLIHRGVGPKAAVVL